MDSESPVSQSAQKLLKLLGELAQRGFVEAMGGADNSIGMTLLKELGISYSSARKPDFEGVVLSARRSSPKKPTNRVNLFARVPNWKLSACKSSKEIVTRYGYDRDGGVRKLYCSVSARGPNAQGLQLKVDFRRQLLHERFVDAKSDEPVATWELKDLKERLICTHPETMWVTATRRFDGHQESFHYREAVYSGAADVELFPTLIEEGTVSVDHLIEMRGKKATEKGPLFKIHPANVDMLFPAFRRFNLLSL